jgi:S1-C subfamily serine protease
VLHLLAAGNTVSDPWGVTFSEAASYLRFIAAVDQKATVYRPWTGLISVDTRLHEGVPVLRVVGGSPAAQAGIQPGEVLYAAEGKPINQSADLIKLVEARKAGEQLSLHLKGASGTRAVAVPA